MTPRLWATIRDRTAPRVQATIDMAFEKHAKPVPYDILNCADAQNLGHPQWAMAIFGLLPIDNPVPGHFPHWEVWKPGRKVEISEHVHARHFDLFLETRPAGWAPAVEIVRW
jgi:hypothetical protein